MRRGKRRKVFFDEHHIFPSSRFPELRKARWNIRGIRRNRHVAWHILVDNMTPLEALVELFYEFCPSDIEKLILDPALEKFRNILMRLPK